MKELIVYHGTTLMVEHPICKFGRPNLDFGQGFYLTDVRQQAIDWAIRMARSKKETPVLNRYKLNREGFLSEGHALIFKAYDEEWLRLLMK